jgi:hypothetical protein
VKTRNIYFESDSLPRRFRTGVSLHGHTLHSEETLDFIYKLSRQFPPMAFALKKGEERYRAAHDGRPLDLRNAWWTPPCAPLDAWKLECAQIHNFGMNALVSLTDHDSIDAPLNLRVLDACRDIPISVEWTVPFENTFFHLGIHNIAPDHARETMAELAAFTAHPEPSRLVELLDSLAGNPATLIVFNHPNWDERGIGEEAHRDAARRFTTMHLDRLHAFELNGLRPWKENKSVFALAEEFGKPLISGGDRHALEPNTILNLTNAVTFAQFVAEIRGGESHVFVTNQYKEPFVLRIVQNIEDILRDNPNHALGWRKWSDRTFYRYENGEVRNLGSGWQDREPLAVTIFVRGLHLLRHPSLRQAFRFAFARKEVML